MLSTATKAETHTRMPELFGILHRHFEGDEALLRLAQGQLERATMGAEVYPATEEEAVRDWQYVPRGLPRHMIHLPRHWDAFSAADRALILAFAQALPGRVRGLVFHDGVDWPVRIDELAAALAQVDEQLAALPGRPMLFLEYASSLELDDYLRVLARLSHLRQVSACIDTGHVIIFSAHRSLTARHRDLDVWKLDPSRDGLAALASDFERAGRQATDDVVGLVDGVARLGKPMHFHLHDGHLLSRLSRYGVSDHLPFGERIPVSTSLAPSGALSAILGAEGVRRILAAVLAHLSPDDVSLTLEIHPNLHLTRKPLGEWGRHFIHGTDLSNAELTHAWLDQVAEQAALVRRLCGELGP